MSEIPLSPETFVNRLTVLSRLLWTGLELGAQDVHQYFSRRAHDTGERVELNRCMATDIVRYNALAYLVQNRRLGSDYYFEEMTNNGISVRFPWGAIKVYKMFEGGPPTAHNTEASRAFYSANSYPFLSGVDWTPPTESSDWKDIAPTLQRLNLIYCWEVDRRFNVIQLRLFCPRKSGKYKEGVRLFWSRSIAHPITGIKVPTVNDASGVDDLPIFFEDVGEQDGDD
jgi:hypothetical protein